MKLIINIVRFIVGILFIFSGLVKAIDPLGLSYKMNEFFAKWNWDWAPPFSLTISIVMIAFEIFAGIALLLGWRPKLITRLLLLLIIFFTFLTGYAYLSGKFHSCGCFGDCIPITSGVSFTKDLVLTVLIVILCAGYKNIGSLLGTFYNFFFLLLGTLASIYLMVHVLRHLPARDCLPYAEGNDLAQKMLPPPGAIPDSIVVNYVYKKEGKEVKFDAEHFPDDFNDSTYEYVDRVDVIARKGNATPPIADFALKTLNGTDTTQAMLAQTGKYVLFMVRDFDGTTPSWEADFKQLDEACKAKNIPLFVITNMGLSMNDWLNGKAGFNRTVLVCDAVPMKTFVRAKVGVVLMNGAVITEKYNVRDVDDAIEKLGK